MDKFEQIFRTHHYNLAAITKKSSNWFTQQATMLATHQISPQRLIRDSAGSNVVASYIRPGELYIFNYIAKHKDTLPFWDTYPLVFPFRKVQGGFIGLNMHYLPYPLRIKLLSGLMQYRSGSNDENTRLKLSWQMLQGVSGHQLVAPCVHRYLLPHIKSAIKKIDSDDWATAMMLPVERFSGASKQQVWRSNNV